jgi:hypothetical protein
MPTNAIRPEKIDEALTIASFEEPQLRWYTSLTDGERAAVKAAWDRHFARPVAPARRRPSRAAPADAEPLHDTVVER